jgi:hypothetical protein
MIARNFALDAKLELRDVMKVQASDWNAVVEILYQLIRASIAHARSQEQGRKTGTMTFDEAMELMRTRNTFVTRPSWGIFNAIRRDDDGKFWYFTFDNCDGYASGGAIPTDIPDEDRAATDWMLYETPDENWVELEFDRP